MSKVKSFRQKYLEQSRKYQADFRTRKQAEGWKQVSLWLDKDTLEIIGNRRGMELSKFISDAIKDTLTSKITSNPSKNLTSKHNDNLTSKKSARYMTQDLEQEILKLKNAGMSLTAISKALEQQGYVSTTGRPYSTGTISKVITRVKARSIT